MAQELGIQVLNAGVNNMNQSNCCGAQMENEVCMDCKEHASPISKEEKIKEIHETIKNLAVFMVDTKLEHIKSFNQAMNQAESQIAELHELLKE